MDRIQLKRRLVREAEELDLDLSKKFTVGGDFQDVSIIMLGELLDEAGATYELYFALSDECSGYAEASIYVPNLGRLVFDGDALFYEYENLDELVDELMKVEEHALRVIERLTKAGLLEAKLNEKGHAEECTCDVCHRHYSKVSVPIK